MIILMFVFKMDLDYYEITSELDAREVLRYLNDLGIRNISGEVLKYFITDLKKLIKYDLQQKENLNYEIKPEVTGPERLHSASTFSSRSRSRATKDSVMLNCCKDCAKPRNHPITRHIQSAPTLHRHEMINIEDKPFRRSCTCVRHKEEQKKPESSIKEKINTAASSKNLIKVPKQPMKKKCDPVSLYHYYTSLWAKYKSNVPGENNWSDLRWNVRQKMAGNIVQSKDSEALQVRNARPSRN